MKKGQSSIDYLVILVVVIIVALIVVAVMGGIPGINLFDKEERFDVLNESQIATLYKSTSPEWTSPSRNLGFDMCKNMYSARLELRKVYLVDYNVHYNESTNHFQIECVAKSREYTIDYSLKII